jgi:hypothetical protein
LIVYKATKDSIVGPRHAETVDQDVACSICVCICRGVSEPDSVDVFDRFLMETSSKENHDSREYQYRERIGRQN